jgi:ribonucleoside-triphosphate reductase
MNEAMLNFYGANLGSKESRQFALEIMDFMNEKMINYQLKTGDLYNLEATPAEGTTYRFARVDKKQYPDIIVANEEAFRKGAEPYYTNSTWHPVNFTDDMFELLDVQDEFQTKYTGGTVLHNYIGERINDLDSYKMLVKKIAENYTLPYFTITPTFSICPVHGYLAGEHQYCPRCDEEIGYKEQLEIAC